MLIIRVVTLRGKKIKKTPSEAFCLPHSVNTTPVFTFAEKTHCQTDLSLFGFNNTAVFCQLLVFEKLNLNPSRRPQKRGLIHLLDAGGNIQTVCKAITGVFWLIREGIYEANCQGLCQRYFHLAGSICVWFFLKSMTHVSSNIVFSVAPF